MQGIRGASPIYGRCYVSALIFRYGEYMKSFKNPFSRLTRFELILLISSLIVVTLSFILSPEKDIMSLISSLIGVTALIFISKGMAFGQLLIIIFAVMYGIISFSLRYYGEMITYIFMTGPMALAALIEWLKNPYEDTEEVKVRAELTRGMILALCILTLCVTTAFYFILKLLGTANLTFATLSVATSFFAAALTYLRSPYYALGYAANDLVLIILWILAAASDISYLPMIFCFVMFLFNDLYGFFNWKRIRTKQSRSQKE